MARTGEAYRALRPGQAMVLSAVAISGGCFDKFEKGSFVLPYNYIDLGGVRAGSLEFC